MKTLTCLLIAAGALASPVISFAQSNAPLTRAEVRADLIRVEQAGYNPSAADDVNYPADIQAAETRIAAQDNKHMANDAVGGTTMSGTSAAGSHLHLPKPAPSSCVGPASYCDIFFGS
ncbi:DUF4148 domain-containing protein [Paraburkholderia susongensis]|uniref:DUF4148 domain-containing protein n=1 Tax=Paraburkholderia susongensis TaxID=1515439 RepID=A0A1X7L4Z3_9BURK|nr:DUF4148 domain-containing protein [Paraburkholderia susongensis]SMG48697.1 protein of unknown function [Paraburkholderia susongensis]